MNKKRISKIDIILLKAGKEKILLKTDFIIDKLNSLQNCFDFHFDRTIGLGIYDKYLSYSRDYLVDVIEKNIIKVKNPIIGILNKQMEGRIFGFSRKMKKIGVITIDDWSYFAPPSEEIYAIYYIANLTLRFLSNIPSHQLTKGCLFDYCENKMDIKIGMRKSFICDSCLKKIKMGGVNQLQLDCIYGILDWVQEQMRPFNAIEDSLLKQSEKHCMLCFSKKDLEIHHVVPVSEGGGNNADNMIVLCPKCHRRINREAITPEEIKRIGESTIKRVKEGNLFDVKRMDNYQFENIVSTLLSKIGYEVIQQQYRGEDVIDILAYGRSPIIGKPVKYIIECKTGKRKIGVDVLRQIYSRTSNFNSNFVVCISNNEFTSSAKDYAEANDIDLIDRKKLMDLLNKYNIIKQNNIKKKIQYGENST